MNREQLAHVLRAASGIVDDPDILVIGSQSLLASYNEDELPLTATASMELDLAYFDDPDDLKADSCGFALAYPSWEERRGGSQIGCRATRTASPMAAAPANAATLCP